MDIIGYPDSSLHLGVNLLALCMLGFEVVHDDEAGIVLLVLR